MVAKIRSTLTKHLKQDGHKFSRRQKLKVGHGGTLDPLATGLLVIGVGTGCRQLQGYLSGGKGYRAKGVLGSETDTQDSTGKVTIEAPREHVKLEELEAAAATLVGEIWQRPPIFSALSRDGKRMYELARAGKADEEMLEPRRVTVHELSVESYLPESGTFELNVRCGGGVYVRTLIREIGRSVSSAAHMTALERTQQGPFFLDQVEPVREADMFDPERLLQALVETQVVLDAQPRDPPPADGAEA